MPHAFAQSRNLFLIGACETILAMAYVKIGCLIPFRTV